MFKPWLSKSILDITKSTERDYPPKRKKPWLADSFAEMEHFHEQNYIPGGGNIAPNPCGGGSLNFDILPGTIDCDGGAQELVFILSDDFKCASIQQISGSGVTIGKKPIEKSRDVTDQLTPTPETASIGGDVRNIVVGTLNPEDAGDEAIICFEATDTCCGGSSIACIFTENCGEDCSAADCELPSITGGDTTTTSSTLQMGLTNPQGTVTWAVSGTDVSIDQSGLVTTGASACGSFTVTATDSCCGNFTQEVRVTDSGYWDIIDTCNATGSLENTHNCIIGIYKYVVWTFWSCDAPCPDTCGNPCDQHYPDDVCGGIPTTTCTSYVQTSEWKCVP